MEEKHRPKERTIDEAKRIAEQKGVIIPEDFELFEAERGELEGSFKELFAGGTMTTAKLSRVEAQPDGYIYWEQHYHDRTRKICVLIHPEVLTSDEAIIAVFEHEMCEMRLFRQAFTENGLRLWADDYGLQCATNRPGNFHDRAWDSANELIARRRGSRT